MRNIIKWCINNSVSMNLLMMFLVIVGFLNLSNLKKETFPLFSLDKIRITVVYPGASPEEVEEGIAIKIEEVLLDIDEIKKIESNIRDSIVDIIVELKAGSDIYRVKDEIESRVNQINTFPVDAEKPIVEDLKIERRVLFITVSGNINEYVLKSITEKMKDELLNYPYISNVKILGVKKYEISIEVSEEKLREYNLTFSELALAIKRNNLDLSGGILRTNQGDILIKVRGKKYYRIGFEDIIIKSTPDGSKIYLRDIATVKDTFEETPIQGYINGKRGTMLEIYTRGDIIKTADFLYKYVKEKQKKLPGIKLSIFADGSKFVKDRLKLLINNGVQGLILVFLCLSFFLDIRLAFWVALGIPISFLGTFILFGAMDLSLNMISMFGLIICLGIIVDDAIVISESVYYNIYEKKMDSKKGTLEGTIRVFWPVVASVTTTIAAFTPLFHVKGTLGKFIGVIPVAVISTLTISLLEALFILPCHLSHSLGIEKEEASFLRKFREIMNKFITKIIKAYSKLLNISLIYRYATLGIAIFILLISVGLVKNGFIKFVIFPKVDTDFIKASIEYPETVSSNLTTNTILYMDKKLWELNEILKKEYNKKEDIVKRAYTTVMSTNKAQITIELMASEQRNIDSNLILNRWRKLVGDIPGVRVLSYASLSHGPVGRPIEIQLSSNNYKILEKAVRELKEKLKTYPGLYDIRDDLSKGNKELRIKIKPEARSLGINLTDLAQQIRSAFYGNETLRLQRGKFDVKVYVRFPKKEREFLSDINDFIIRFPNKDIPISEVADLKLTYSPSLIKRVDGKRVARVSADLEEKRANAYEITQDLLKTGFLDNLEKKYGVTYSFEGQRKDTKESMESLMQGFLTALIVIYLILATVFSSYFQPLIIMSSIPFGIIGAIIGHLIEGYDITIMSMFGIVALSGIVVNNSLIIIDFINEEVKKGEEIIKAVIKAGERRFRPIFLTTITTILGITPLMFGKNLQAQYLIPMAVSLCYGLLFSTLLTLILIPCGYIILEDILSLFRKK